MSTLAPGRYGILHNDNGVLSDFVTKIGARIWPDCDPTTKIVLFNLFVPFADSARIQTALANSAHEIILVITNDRWILDTQTHMIVDLCGQCSPHNNHTAILRPRLRSGGCGVAVRLEVNTAEVVFRAQFPAGSKTALIGDGALVVMRELIAATEGREVNGALTTIVSLGGFGRVGTFSEQTAAKLDGDKSPLEVMSIRAIPVGRAVDFLRLFGVDRIDKRLGRDIVRRARVLLAYLLAEPPEVLILDNATHYLSLFQCDLLTNYLSRYGGTLICSRETHGLNFGADLSGMIVRSIKK